ncbi:uncharacterized protein N7484_008338 [Penicillium longicatenatum]|uniref:uncharacterized protein n=1 Tax=Penicillium longicatenatum TaxID=1561947 RepID=UPI0025482417|nr:uncharacterized protein N7484_008338 [Penicillium longicatenatum]KAJ5635025.1 hypothetical protein N7484_008338 [Penicillium longicatenatum]
MSLPVQPSPTILLPQLPPKTLVGIDLITFTSTAKFHGIRDLPDGWHFLYTGTTESLSLRSGAWFYIGDINTVGYGHNESALVSHRPKKGQSNEPEIYIWKWSADTESLTSLKYDNDRDCQEAMRYKANLGAIWQSGGLFRYRSRVSKSMVPNADATINGEPAQLEDDDESEESGRKNWRCLTNRIFPDILTRMIGNPNYDVDAHPRWMVTSASTANRDADHIPGLDPQKVGEDGVPETLGEQEREFGFLPVDLKNTWREGAIGRERTEAAQDRSWALGDLIDRFSKYKHPGTGEILSDEELGEAHVLGELQFTFLMVLTMMNYSCLQQWKRLLELVLTSRAAIVDKEGFMSEFVGLLLRQLKRCDDVEGGLFEMDGDDGGAFLRNLLKKFHRLVYQAVDENKGSLVKKELAKLESWVREEFDWELTHESIVKRGMIQLEDGEEVELDMDDNDEDEETGEYAPMIVDSEEATL